MDIFAILLLPRTPISRDSLSQTVGQHQNTLKKFLLRKPRKFLNRFRKQPPGNRLQSNSTRAILMPYGMIVIFILLKLQAPLRIDYIEQLLHELPIP
jgi:hypothetical protein